MDQSRFAREALAEGVRLDLRNRDDFRAAKINVHRFGHVEVSLGKTRVVASTTAEVMTPSPDRPGEGSIYFTVELGPMAGPEFELGRPSTQQHLIKQRIEKLLRGSQAIDNESLCIVAGERVWHLRVNVRAIVNNGNLSDASCIAALSALLSFRKPEVEICGKSSKVYAEDEREPIPLPIHHLPFPTSFAIVDGAWVVDPLHQEESVSTGAVLVGANKQGEVCLLHASGEPLTSTQVLELYVPIAVQRAIDLDEMLQGAMKEYEGERRRKRMKKVSPSSAYSTSGFVDAANAVIESQVSSCQGTSSSRARVDFTNTPVINNDRMYVPTVDTYKENSTNTPVKEDSSSPATRREYPSYPSSEKENSDNTERSRCGPSSKNEPDMMMGVSKKDEEESEDDSSHLKWKSRNGREKKGEEDGWMDKRNRSHESGRRIGYGEERRKKGEDEVNVDKIMVDDLTQAIKKKKKKKNKS